MRLLREGSGLGGRETRSRVNGVVVRAGFFPVGRLEARSVTTFSQVDLGVVVTARREVDVNVGSSVDVRGRSSDGSFLVVMMSEVRELEFEVCVLRFVLFGSAILNVDVCLSPARAVLTIVLASDVNFLGAKLVVSLREVGGDGETFPSDARLS